MKKIGIISEFSQKNINFGNRLQSAALNRFLLKQYPQYEIEYLYFNFFDEMLITKKRSVSEQVERILNGISRRICKSSMPYKGAERRFAVCESFSEKTMTLSKKAYSWEDLVHSDFDVIIVGSDVVWRQRKCMLSRVKFLDFAAQKPFRKISYAASFGRDWIPEENVSDIKRCLSDFQAVSVREASSVELLKKLGIRAVHVLDPTLLLRAEEWESLEKEPGECRGMAKPAVSLREGNPAASAGAKDLALQTGEERFVFTYLLGTDEGMRKAVTAWAHGRGFQVVTVPYASGFYNHVDKDYGDVRILDCSPENWLWLVHHASYVITDSFHGTAFSTIFEKRFVVLERKMSVNINNRMIDFLRTIGQSDKMIPYTELDELEGMEWDYNVINSLLAEKRTFSEAYLKGCLGECPEENPRQCRGGSNFRTCGKGSRQ